jgi:hypothetical protein
MMPTFPSPPLKFRTAGFPRYGFKAGLSDEAFPGDWFAIALRTLCCHRYSLLYVRDDALLSTSVRADPPLYPRGPRSGPGYVVPVHPHLIGPIRPTRGHIQTSPTRGLYQMPSLCIFAYASRRPTTGSELSSILFRNMSPSETTGNFPAAGTQYFTENTGLQLGIKVSAFPTSSHSDSGEECVFEA